MSRKCFDFLKVLHTASLRILLTVTLDIPGFQYSCLRIPFVSEAKFCKLILTGSTRCSLS